MGASLATFHPQKYYLRIYVHPAHDSPDIRPFFLQHLQRNLEGKDLVAITSGMVENCVEAMRFFEAHDFCEVAREAISTLDLTGWDAEGFAGTL